MAIINVLGPTLLSAEIDFRRQNLPSLDVTFWRLKSILALRGWIEPGQDVDLVIFACLICREFLFWDFSRISFFFSRAIGIIFFAGFFEDYGLLYCRSGSIRKVVIFANFARRTNSRKLQLFEYYQIYSIIVHSPRSIAGGDSSLCGQMYA